MQSLTKEDLEVIRDALYSYKEHLEPSGKHVIEVAKWLEKVDAVNHKIRHILLNKVNVY